MKIRRLIRDVVEIVRLRKKIRRAIREKAKRENRPFDEVWAEHVEGRIRE